MSTHVEKTNFSRRYRPAQFADFVEQDLIVRMLKNSIFQNHLFPVYLFSGQRGCGKTTLARLFAFALNCENRNEFIQNPQTAILPCAHCKSCSAAIEGRHPDICEMDAASYTGVDHIRMLTESASFMPTLGTTEVYIIDEAHMLSKASFNALLKLLEEPPATFVCLLVTTDVEKILPTVRSRSFQLLMRPLTMQGIQALLERVCIKEKIEFVPEAIERIAYHARGSGRDALNLLEQVFRSAGSVTPETVRAVRGEVEEKTIENLIRIIFNKSEPAELLDYLQNHPEISQTPTAVWNQICTTLRKTIATKNSSDFTHHAFKLIKHMYAHELGFLKTIHQYSFLEVVLLTALEFDTNKPSFSGSKTGPTSDQQHAVKPIKQNNTGPLIDEKKEKIHTSTPAPVHPQEKQNNRSELWLRFMDSIKQTHDQLLVSIFEQAEVEEFLNQNCIHLLFDKDMQFLQDLLDQKSTVWATLLETAYQKKIRIESKYILDKAVPSSLHTASTSKIAAQAKQPSSQKTGTPYLASDKKITTAPHKPFVKTVLPETLSAEAQEFLRLFPGTVTLAQDNE